MKRRFLYALAKMRRYANTPKGERVVVRTLTVLSGVCVLDVVVFLIGFAL